MRDERPYFTELPLRCGKCEERWMGWQPNNCHADIYVAGANTHKCPKCGGSASVFIVSLPMRDKS